MLLCWYVCVLRLFLLAAMAAALLAITPPIKLVLPLTLTLNPPSPALMPDCSTTLAYVPLTWLLLKLKLPDTAPLNATVKLPPALFCWLA